MKVRNGFVSNSSSSSFIIIGTDKKNVSENFEGQKIFEHVIQDLYLERKNLDELVGIVLADESEEYLPDGECSLEEINKLIGLMSEKMDLPKSEFKLYYGTRPC